MDTSIVTDATQPGGESEWRQHFPTYHFNDRDIVLEEYKAASKTLESAERVFMNAANVTLLVSAVFGSLTLGLLDRLVASARAQLAGALHVQTLLLVLIVLVGTFAVVTLRYFADRHKVIVFSSRKVVVLRRMLGLSYGGLQLVLPNWRTEGADQPFVIRMFPGWSTSIAYPFWVISVFSSAILLVLAAALLREVQLQVGMTLEVLALLGVAGWGSVLAYTYRSSLFDTHENVRLSFAKVVAAILRLRLVPDFEYVIYRAKLATYETSRLGVETEELQKILVFIEDKDFFNHHGISYRGSLRAALGLLRLKTRTGGSTVTQQLVRTLFIVDFDKLLRRKVVEILLALWFDRRFGKTDMLRLYLASVRYDRGVYGVTAALKHFFERRPFNPSPAQAFFLVERVSNLRSQVWCGRIDETMRRAVDSGIVTTQDAAEIVRIYERMRDTGKVSVPNPERFERLVAKWSSASDTSTGP